jgi:uncharacterized protein (DUF1810 family)
VMAAMNLERFVLAQNPIFSNVIAELRSGRKSGHWMWFIFPQIRGLGTSSMARRFAISSLAEAQAYLQHSVLGPRLKDCTQLAIEAAAVSISDMFGYPDDLKFWSSMTLFQRASAEDFIFREALAKYFDGIADANTLALL